MINTLSKAYLLLFLAAALPAAAPVSLKAAGAASGILLSDDRVPENSPVDTLVGHFSAPDSDSAVFTLVNGEGDQDNASFKIEGDALRTNIVFDREIQDLYSIRVRATGPDEMAIERSFLLTSSTPPPPEPLGKTDLSFASTVEGHGVYGLAWQDDGKILIGGSFSQVNGETRRNIARMHPDGSLDADFGGSISGFVSPIAVQDDGKILFGGSSYFGRLHPDGSPDNDFGAGDTGVQDGRVLAIAIQPDGRIIIGGTFSQIGNQVRNRIARLHPDGSLDETFGNGLSGIEGGDVVALAVQTDGKILVGGSFTYVNGISRPRIARLNTDGTIDSTFGTVLDESNSSIRSIVIQKDGKILIGGYFTTVNGELRFRIARLNADGTLDETFGGGLSGANGPVTSIALQDDGKILVGGSFTMINDEPRLRVVRLNVDGTLDRIFGHGVSGFSHEYQSVRSIALSPDEQRLLVGGTFASTTDFTHPRVVVFEAGAPTDPRPLDVTLGKNWFLDRQPVGQPIAAFSPVAPDADDLHTYKLVDGDGDADNESFTIEDNILKTAKVFDAQIQDNYTIRVRATNSAGLFVKRTFSLTIIPAPEGLAGDLDLALDGGSFDGPVRTIARQEDGKWIVGGSFKYVQNTPRSGIARLNADGTLDRSFLHGLRGAGASWGDVHTVALQNDGKILIGGYFTWLDGDRPRHLARLNSDGTVDDSFASLELQHFSTREPPPISWIGVQEDGKIVIGGIFREINGIRRNGVAMLNSDGTLDLSFDPIRLNAFNHWQGTALAIQDDGKILIAGTGGNYEGSFSGLMRLNSDGTQDQTFVGYAPVGSINLIAPQPNGSIIIGRSFSIFGEERAGILRLHENGDLNTSFNHRIAEVSGVSPRIHSVAVHASGKILIGGEFTRAYDEPRNRVARFNPDGTLDSSFGNGAAGANRSVFAVSMSGDREILIGGEFETVNGVPRQGVARLQGGDQILHDLRLSYAAVVENQPIGTTVGVFTATDPFKGQVQAVFSPIPGEGDGANAAFRIEGNELRTAGIMDHEMESAHSVRVRAVAVNGTAVERIFSVAVKPAPERRPMPDELDHSFQPPANINNVVRSVAQQTNEKWIVGGLTSIDGDPVQGRLARLNIDGTHDAGFTANIPTHERGVWQIGLQDDDRIIASGVGSQGRIGRLNPDGSPDATFFSTLYGFESIALQNGKALIGGSFGIKRLNPSGWEEAFGGGESGVDGTVYAISLQEDRKVLIGGFFSSINGQPRGRIARLNADGTLDQTFGYQASGANSAVLSLAPQPDGKVLIGGVFTTVDGHPQNRIARLNTNGTLDSSFAAGLAGADGVVRTIQLQSDGKILIGGSFTTVHGVPRNRIARLNQDGSLDASFGNDWGGADDTVSSIAVQTDGRIVVGGSFTSYDFVPRSRVMRLHGGSAGPGNILLSNQLNGMDHSVGALVGTLSATDPGDPGRHTFALVPGEGDEGNSLFTIEENELRTAVDIGPEMAGNYTIRVRAANPEGLFTRKIFRITVDNGLYRAWAEPLPEDQRSPTGDPGGFGIPNILRYAFGMDPLQPERGILPRAGQLATSPTIQSLDTQGGSGSGSSVYLTLTYTRRTDDPALLYIVEVSGDLESWLPFDGVEEVTDDNNDETETVTAIDTEPMEVNGKRFMRLRVER